MSSGGTNTVSTQSQPPAAYQSAYLNTLAQAQNVASTPYSQYSGNTVAALSPDQNAAISTVQNAQGIANPYINSAAGYINNSTAPLWSGVQQFSPGAVSQYQSPYTQSVLNTTVAAENNQDAQQQQGIVGNAVSQGAFGGDRSAVAQGITAGQQATANNTTNAGIENQGYTQALGEFNQQQTAQLGANQANAWLNSQAGYGMGNLGNEALTTTLTGANAQMSAGSTEQAQAQSLLNVPYQQYLAQQAYPYQTTGWLSSIEGGLGSSAGGSGYTSSPAASPFSQALGAATAGAGLYGSGALGAIGSGLSSAYGTASGLLSAATFAPDALALEAASSAGAGGIASGAGEALGLLAAARHGGEIPHRDVGGGIPGSPVSWIPSISGQRHGSGIPAAPHALPSGSGDDLQSSLQTLKTTGAFGQDGWLTGHNSTPDQSAARGGGIVVPFPGRRASGGGIVTNDNWYPHPERARASGGGLSVSIQPGSYAGSPGVPQISTSGGGITSASPALNFAPSSVGALGQGASSSNPAVAQYLGSTLAGASMAPPPATPTTNSAATAPASDSVGLSSVQNGGAFLKRGGGIVRRADGGSTDDPDPSWFSGPGLGHITNRPVGGNLRAWLDSRHGNDAPSDAAPHGAAPDDSVSSGPTHFVSTRHPTPPDMDVSNGGSSWQDEEDVPGSHADVPSIDAPYMGAGSGRAAPAIRRGIVAASAPSSARAASGSPGGGQSIPTPPVPPGDDGGSGSGIVQSAPTKGAGDGADKSDNTSKGADRYKADPWLALAAAGFGIMGGTSHQAGVNIGRGAMEGLQFYEKQKENQNSADLRQMQQEQNDLYRKGLLADKGRGRDIQSDRATTYAQLSQASAAQKMAAAALESAKAASAGNARPTEGSILNDAVSSLADGKTINPDTQQPWTKSEALMHIRGVDSLSSHRQAQDDQGWARVQNGSDANDIRRSAFDETVRQHNLGNDIAAQRLVESRIRNMSGDAVRMYLGSKDPITGKFGITPDQAEAQASGFRGSAGGSQSAAPAQKLAAAPQFQEGKTYVDGSGNKAVYQNGQWMPVQ